MHRDSIIISVHPEHVKKILSGKKRYEFRRVISKKDIDKIIIYATAPVGKVLAIAEIEKIISESPDIVWKQTKKYAGVSSDFFYQYFEGKHTAHAFKLKNIKEIKDGIPLQKMGSSIKAPQSFMYLSKKQLSRIEAAAQL